jgi:hypothetical protein
VINTVSFQRSHLAALLMRIIFHMPRLSPELKVLSGIYRFRNLYPS